MRDDDFEWDDAKAVANLAAHGVSFEAARLAFDDTFACDYEDTSEDYGEQRFVLIGMVEGRLLTVVYTEREERTRIISARGAEPYEARKYHEEE
jgi:uncharacterized protein